MYISFPHYHFTTIYTKQRFGTELKQELGKEGMQSSFSLKCNVKWNFPVNYMPEN